MAPSRDFWGTTLHLHLPELERNRRLADGVSHATLATRRNDHQDRCPQDHPALCLHRSGGKFQWSNAGADHGIETKKPRWPDQRGFLLEEENLRQGELAVLHLELGLLTVEDHVHGIEGVARTELVAELGNALQNLLLGHGLA